jgi:hypothetical protein
MVVSNLRSVSRAALVPFCPDPVSPGEAHHHRRQGNVRGFTMGNRSYRSSRRHLYLLGVLLLLPVLDTVAQTIQVQPLAFQQAVPQQESRGFVTSLVNGEASWLGPFAILVPLILAGLRFRDHHKRGQQNRERLEEERFYDEAAAVQNRPSWMATDASTSFTVRPAWMSGEEDPSDRPKWLSEASPGTTARPILPPLGDTPGKALPAQKAVGQ